MLMFVTFALVATTALAAPAGPMATTMGPNTKLCCPPKKWSAMMYDLKSSSGLDYVTEFAQDAENMLEGSVTIKAADGTILSQTFTDYANMKMYTINRYGDQASKCVVSTPSHGFYDDCYANVTNIITNQKYVGNATLGGDVLKYNVFTFDLWGDVKATMAFSADKCIPILENVSSVNEKIDSLFLFNDVTTNVEPRLLQMPAACIGASNGGVVG